MSAIDVKVLNNPESARIEYNGVTYTQVDEDAAAGDLIRIITTAGAMDVTKGGYYDIQRIRHDGDPEIIDDGGDVRDAGFFNYEVFRKIEPEAVKAGDWVRITESQSNWPEGTVVKVEFCDEGNTIYATDGHKSFFSDYYEKVDGPEYARVIRLSPSMYGFEIGDIVEVSTATGTHDYRLERKNGLIGFGNSEHLAPATKEDYDKSTAQSESCKLSAGDYAKVVLNKANEEVVKAKAEYEESAKWTAIGRKPNEFRKGDIVVTVGGDSGHKGGTIGEVRHPINSDRPQVEARYEDGRILSLYSKSELIVPVEQRFDRK